MKDTFPDLESRTPHSCPVQREAVCPVVQSPSPTFCAEEIPLRPPWGRDVGARHCLWLRRACLRHLPLGRQNHRPYRGCLHLHFQLVKGISFCKVGLTTLHCVAAVPIKELQASDIRSARLMRRPAGVVVQAEVDGLWCTLRKI